MSKSKTTEIEDQTDTGDSARPDRDPAGGPLSNAASASAETSGPNYVDGYLEDEDEPVSLAEEIADEVDRGIHREDTDDQYEKIKQGEIHIAELQKMSMSQLIDEARHEKLKDVMGMKKQDLIFKILKERVKMNGLMYGEGTLEILPDGFGFLRSPDYHYLSCPDDIYVSPSQIRRFGLKTGATVAVRSCCWSNTTPPSSPSLVAPVRRSTCWPPRLRSRRPVWSARTLTSKVAVSCRPRRTDSVRSS